MDKLEKILQEIHDANITIKNIDTEELIGFAVEYQKKQRIILNKSKIRNRTHEHTILAHEFCHFRTGTLYSLNDDEITIDKNEYKCNKYMIQKLVPIEKLKELLKKQYQKHEIAFYFDIEESIIDLAYTIYTQMGVDFDWKQHYI